ncbi:MAG: hypothetical protein SFX73_37135 [Kofleriaceae bacterium]|nr:hypothetical protein [Kofleriaceae bacterium]
MRTMLAMFVISATAHVVRADPAQDLAARGEALARDGRLTEAIDAFKQADRLAPRASHACLIALAYIRRELWTQADLFLARCRERASGRDPAPDWLPLAEQQLRKASAAAQLAPIDVRVEPTSVHAAIAISSFSLDEQFGPRKLQLPRGHHVLVATAPDRAPVRRIVEVTDASVQRVVLRFDEPATPLAPQLLAGIGGATLATGLGYHVFVREPRRNLTYALYGAGGAALLTGLVLRYTVYRAAPEDAPRISAGVGHDATTVAVEWLR